MSNPAENPRKPEHPVDSMFYDRWSPRAFTTEAISDGDLKSGFEAARWAPSSANSQPWRFVYAKRGSAQWETFTGFLVDGNRAWADKAAALVIVLSKKDFKWGDRVVAANSHSFDTGSAWMSFALQLENLGWATHGMGGIHADKIREALKLPENIAIECAIAVGKKGNADDLPAPFKEREKPSDRRPLAQTVSEGVFPPAWAQTE